MHPKSWRLSKNLTLKVLSKRMGGIADGYLSEIERGKKKASGRVISQYYALSNGEVTPGDFPKVKRPRKAKRR